MELIGKCHDAGFPVVCDGVPPTVGDRLPCGYYQVSLHGEDLGVWSELGLQGVLSQLCHEFYRARLVESLDSMFLRQGVSI
ncbi:hypothetical protein [Nostoc sp. NIES-3756]|uniref:hypothetical protein n=1 Tax=Nostoc sp. NIES-3756 TaxID=1751286 RepID=UPI00187DC175|nr:hypothetical protein [Nostoc sp. NIES-3756]